MLNLIIAVMSSTYEKYKESTESLYVKEIVTTLPYLKYTKKYGGLSGELALGWFHFALCTPLYLFLPDPTWVT